MSNSIKRGGPSSCRKRITNAKEAQELRCSWALDRVREMRRMVEAAPTDQILQAALASRKRELYDARFALTALDGTA